MKVMVGARKGQVGVGRGIDQVAVGKADSCHVRAVDQVKPPAPVKNV